MADFRKTWQPGLSESRKAAARFCYVFVNTGSQGPYCSRGQCEGEVMPSQDLQKAGAQKQKVHVSLQVGS